MRITKKIENNFYELTKENEIYGEENGIRLVQIVGEYEDIEEELGISLITLIRASKDGVYLKKKRRHYHADVDLKYNCLRLTNPGFSDDGRDFEVEYVTFKDYKRLWALTKEELV